DTCILFFLYHHDHFPALHSFPTRRSSDLFPAARRPLRRTSRASGKPRRAAAAGTPRTALPRIRRPALSHPLADTGHRLADRADAVPDDVWAEAGEHYDEQGLAELLVSIATINAWNRINAATRQPAPAAG